MTDKKNKEIKAPSSTKLFFDKNNLYFLVCLIALFILFIPTINRPWLIYDERIIFDNIHFPIPNSFQEIFEIIENFGTNFNLISSNLFYTSNYVNRNCPNSLTLNLLTSFFLGKSPLLYHLLNLSLHIVNTFLFYLILKFFVKGERSNIFNQWLLVILTLLWAIHPVMMESVLLSTNYGATLSYIFFFCFILDFLCNKEKNKSTLIRRILIPLIFLIPMLTNEYIVALPLVLFVISFYETYQNNTFKDAIKKTIIETAPYFLGLFLYILVFLSLNYKISYLKIGNEFIILAERVLWLAPQIFFHLVKLVFYPRFLTIDQTYFIKLGDTIFDPYSIFCILFLFIWLFVPLLIFLVKRRLSNIFLSCWGFFFALLPFLHILTPSYTLAQERYLYAPLALFIFGIANIRRRNPVSTATTTTTTATIVLLSILLSICFVRSYIRTLDWKDNFSFVKATYETRKEPLLNAIKLSMLAKTVKFFEPNKSELAKAYNSQATTFLKQAKKETLALKKKHQKQLPLVIKSYGLDYDTLLSKIAYLETNLRCNELGQAPKLGIKILKPFMRDLSKADPLSINLYANLLTLDNNYKEAKEILLKFNSSHPHLYPILIPLFNIEAKFEKNTNEAKKYLTELLKFYPYDALILGRALAFYKESNNPQLIAKYAYMYGLRTGSKFAYQEALANFLDINQLKNANKTIKKLIKMDPNDPETLYFVSKYYYKTKNYERALSYLKDAYILSQQKGVDIKLAFDVTHALARLYIFLGNKEGAINVVEDLSNLAGNNKDNLLKLARLYKTLEQKENLNSCLKKLRLLGVGA